MPKIKNAIELKVPTALPTSYVAEGPGAWVSSELDAEVFEKVKLLLVVSGGYDGTSIEIRGLIVATGQPLLAPGGEDYDEHKSDGTLDEQTLIVTTDGNYALEYQTPSFDLVKFLAKRTGGTQGNLQLSALGG